MRIIGFLVILCVTCLLLIEAKPIDDEILNQEILSINKEEIHKSQLPDNETQKQPQISEEQQETHKSNIVERDVDQSVESVDVSFKNEICSLQMLHDLSLRQEILESMFNKLIVNIDDSSLIEQLVMDLRQENCITSDEAYLIILGLKKMNLNEHLIHMNDNKWYENAVSNVINDATYTDSRAEKMLLEVLHDLFELSEETDDKRYEMLKELLEENLLKYNDGKNLKEELMELNKISTAE